MSELTPMMKQYFSIKNKHKDCILFYRLGDFYEMFFDDAKLASKELGIILTARDCGDNNKAPMCGVPFHSADNYIGKLVKKGYKVAICEQVEDAKKTKKIVKRDVVRIITPGTILDDNILENGKNNYIIGIYETIVGFGIAIADVTTGEFLTTSFLIDENKKVIDEIAKFNPAEIITNSVYRDTKIIEDIFDIQINKFYDWTFEYINSYKKLCEHFNVLSLSGFGINDNELCIGVSGSLLEYLYITQKNSLKHISSIRKYDLKQFMFLDISSRKNLELCATIKDGKRKGSLLNVLDKTKTSMGARLLRKWIEAPLIDYKEIKLRLDAVEEYKNNIIFRNEIQNYLSNVRDIERIISKIVYKTANAREINFLKSSIAVLGPIKKMISTLKTKLNKDIYDKLDCLDDIYYLIDSILKEDEIPISIKEGNIIKDNYNETIDKYREAKNKGNIWLENLLEKEKSSTGIKNLKIKYNKIIGYYIEVTNSYRSFVPEYYIRKQTLSNSERYVTLELKNIEETILNAEENLAELEYEIFENLRNKIAENVTRIQSTANILAIIDIFQSLGDVAEKNRYVKPIANNNGIIDIKDGRHPVVELYTKDMFIPNDTFLDENENTVAIITGPNMAGKSTYMRQTALIVLMTQIGSFVPASKAVIGIVDRIFTRVGASDDLAMGQSTFMVEMIEVANILNYATRNSLLILDEVGRGTSTKDGLSIALSVLEYIADKNKIGAKTLFATHYHELTAAEGNVKGVVNYCVKVDEVGKDIVFLRKIEKGTMNKSFGIHVASLAGLPEEVICYANEILNTISYTNIISLFKNNEEPKMEPIYFSNKKPSNSNRSSKYNDIITELREIDMETLSAEDAIKMLYNLKNKIK